MREATSLFDMTDYNKLEWHFCIKISYLENKSNMTVAEVTNKVYDYFAEERNQLTKKMRTAAMKLFSGENLPY